MLCRHCGRAPVNRPRGLCWTCYYTPGLRHQYPSQSKFGRRTLEDFNGGFTRPAEPTEARPGSPEKVSILEQRARNKQSLWHPHDAPLDVESRLLNIW